MRTQATERLTAYFAKHAILAILTEILTASQHWQVRQLAAVLLRRRLMKSWRKLAASVKAHLKTAFLQAVVSDPKCVSFALLGRPPRMALCPVGSLTTQAS